MRQEKTRIEINFIEISKIIDYVKNKKKGWKKCIAVNPMDIIIVGVKNKYWFIKNNLL